MHVHAHSLKSQNKTITYQNRTVKHHNTTSKFIKRKIYIYIKTAALTRSLVLDEVELQTLFEGLLVGEKLHMHSETQQ